MIDENTADFAIDPREDHDDEIEVAVNQPEVDRDDVPEPYSESTDPRVFPIDDVIGDGRFTFAPGNESVRDPERGFRDARKEVTRGR